MSGTVCTRVLERRSIVVTGTVQGVGFRPFVHALAARLKLAGRVWNHQGDVQIEIEGEGTELEEFLREMERRPPPLARIERVTWEKCEPTGEAGFRIETSTRELAEGLTGRGDGAGRAVTVAADAATCPDCLRELFDPADRRFGYPFLNCAHCGPRLTIVTGAPYDRERTTMREFAMCPECRAEYENPADRRFHAEPIACPRCGPGLELRDASGKRCEAVDPLAEFAAAILAGKIGAMKGLGGFHLVCDAGNAAAVAELRRRKHRDAKPFAVMVVNAESAAEMCTPGAAERAVLESRRRPIVLLKKRGVAGNGGATGGRIEPMVAPGNPELGVMLPYTPLHHLLMRAVGGRALVMTSGNRSDEPIAYQNADAGEQLAGIAEIYLTHNREIHLRCDDSVVRVVDGEQMPLRRSRGYAPEPLNLPLDCPAPMLAVGGQLKNAFALAAGRRAVLSQHMGDLDHLSAYRAFERDIGLYQELFEIEPEVIVHDLHPDYASTRYALGRECVKRIAVQHHHAHLASCMAEHGITGPAIGVILDGTGYGTDGAVWGGEFLIGDYAGFRRAGHLRYVGLPGGDAAAREGWRMAVSHLLDAGLSTGLVEKRFGERNVSLIRQMCERRINTPMTSSMGRLFDAVSALAGICEKSSYEGQAAMMLEWAAGDDESDGAYLAEIVPDETAEGGGWVADTRRLIRAVAEDAGRGEDPGVISRRFHAGIAQMVGEMVEKFRDQTGIDTVCLSGGVFMNLRLMRAVQAILGRKGLCVLRQRLVPCNDAGIALGQIAVGAARMAGGKKEKQEE